MRQKGLSSKELVRYGSLALPVAFAGFPLYVLAPDFYATQYQISLSSLAFVIFVLRLIDSFQDPLLGYISDQYRQYTLKSIILASILLPLSIYGLFQTDYVAPLLMFCLFMVLATSAFSLLSINLYAQGALWGKNQYEQTRISSYREAFAVIGLLISIVLPHGLIRYFDIQQSYVIYALILSILMLVALFLFLSWSKLNHKRDLRELNYKQTSHPLAHFKKLSHPSKPFFVIYFLSFFASSFPAVLIIFFVRDFLDLETYIGLFLCLYFLSGLLSIPFWKQLSRIKNEYKTWLYAMLFASFCFVGVLFLEKGDLWQYCIICILTGIAFGADLIFPPSLLANYIHTQNTEDSMFSQYSYLTFIMKISFASASVLAFLLLDIFKFQPMGQNTQSALWGLKIIYALLPSIIKITAAYCLWRFLKTSIKGGNHEKISFSHHLNYHREH